MQSKHFLGGVVALCLLGLSTFLTSRRETSPAPAAPTAAATPQHATPTPPETPAIAAPVPGPATPRTNASSAQPAPAPRFSVAAIPTGTALHRELERLAPAARARAVAALDRMTCGIEDANSLHVDAAGALYYACRMHALPVGAHVQSAVAFASASLATATPPGTGSTALMAVPVAQPPVRHSRPGATAVLYLDFNGHSITGAAWNNATDTRPAVATYDCRAYDTDGDPTRFSDQEQADIIQIWERVAEDYAPFAIDVTTEEPPAFGPRTARALITSSTDRNGTAMPASDAGGVAYRSVFGLPNYATYYSPALAYFDNLSSRPEYIAETVSHEVGHNFGLHHDGITGGDEYYGGHGSGDTSWGPLMGTVFNRNVTQWSKGEYADANNTEDDVQLISAQTGFAPDDVGNLTTAATALTVVDFAFSASGIIGTNTDTDLYSFTKEAGACSFSAKPYRAGFGTNGGNVDLVLTLLDSAGTVLATSAPDATTAAMIATGALPAGTYFLKVGTNGTGAPLGQPRTGYTVYGSLGRYTLTGQLPDPFKPVITGPGSGSGTFGEALELWITVDRPVTSYQASGLPTGVSVDPGTGRISGVPQQAGTFQVSLAVASAGGSAQSAFTLTIAAAPPYFTSQPARRIVVGRGEPFTLSASGVGAANPPYYSLYCNGESLYGSVQPVFHIISAAYHHSGWYQIVASDSFGTRRSDPTFVTVAPPDAELRHFGEYPLPKPTNTGGLVDVAAGRSHALALRRDGTVVSWGVNTAGQLEQPAGLTDVVAIAAGDAHSLALRTDGTVRVWGGRAPGGTATPAALNPPTGLSNVVAIAARGDNCMALRGDGTVAVWGLSAAGLQPPGGLGTAREIALGRDHAVALPFNEMADAIAWGDNTCGQITVVPAIARPTSIFAGDRVTIGLYTAIFPASWNDGPAPARLGVIAPSYEQLRTIALSDTHRVVLCESGALRVWTGDPAVAPTLAGLDRENAIFKVAAGHRFTLLLRSPGDFSPLTVERSPQDGYAAPGEPVTFYAAFSGSEPATYRWQASPPDVTAWVDLADGAEYQGTTTWQFTLNTLSYDRKGWRYRCVGSNAPGVFVATAAARPYVRIDVGASPLSTRVSAGSNASFTASFSLDEPDLRYRWQSLVPTVGVWTDITDGDHFRGANSRTLEILAAPATLNGLLYHCIASGPYCVDRETYPAYLYVDGGWASFRSSCFSGSELADSGISGEAADPDGDGISNLLEYAFGLNPREADSRPLLRLNTVGNSLQLGYTPSSGATDLSFTLQSSPDLRTWTDVPGSSPVANEPVFVNVAGDTTAFYRVAVRFR